MAPPSRTSGRILPLETLAAFGASPLYPPLKGISHGDGSSQAASSSAAARAHGRPSQSQAQPPMRVLVASSTPSSRGVSTTSSEKILPNGIQIGGWKITTQNSTIGDEKRMEELTMFLEETANNNPHDDDTNSNSKAGQISTRRKRRLCPPEITFLDAIVSFQKEDSSSSNNLIESAIDGEFTTEIRFTARDALLEWAEAHNHLEMQHQDHNHQTPSSSREEESRGVSILRTADAKIWSDKPRTIDAATSSNSEFYYDWTFSSPYAGTIRHSTINQSTGTHDRNDGVNNRRQWLPLQQSHIPFHLLQDTSQPILLYDDIHLYEDDLHDNGDVSLNIKIRVMPRCWYVLQRLFVRVDHMCVKCRDVRYFCLFDDSNGSNEKDVRVNTIYRDVVWREATWEELGRLALPTDPAAWREEGNGGGTAPGMPAPPALAALLTRLPVVALPDDLPKFACFEVVKE
mmetsp:Transcript_25283/g.45525  ORF Transcript_25283/g.45525 Transcript_25283/m.45525 type:complete len:459 (-) Transcript_25283:207-1583(-)|eukprot:CAMPEP_0201937518 /NCGR_PEP_ID=MMETSP0903-20130614/39656_1 /ASSEMBLY_ACC=CAM_ASM_000552 /TAXON_ID=420261 /ORGANISM="Thalassiosira antarctica, Strain CCMP982" /LENGTH=458 /DNA_ID=CAMNT_0048478527 /DNA_START=28 /DNA_END=1404 /DNA_ORIENTATION=+